MSGTDAQSDEVPARMLPVVEPGEEEHAEAASPASTSNTATSNTATATSTSSAGATSGVRLQKVLAAAGVGSRRACEVLIEEGRIEVDGVRVTQQGLRVDPDEAVIRVDGERLVTRGGLEYVVLNKPRGMLTTMSDDRGRACVGDLVADRRTRLFHVGRLDADSEGLLILTNDGELAHRLTHPAHGVPKTYLAEVPGPIPKDLGRRLRRGVELEDGPVTVDRYALVDEHAGRALIELVLHEGRNHVVRRLLEEVGHPVGRLVRTAIGPLRLDTLKAGRLRHLTRHEVTALYSSVGL